MHYLIESGFERLKKNKLCLYTSDPSSFVSFCHFFRMSLNMKLFKIFKQIKTDLKLTLKIG